MVYNSNWAWPFAWQLGINPHELLNDQQAVPPYKLTTKTKNQIFMDIQDAIARTWVQPFGKNLPNIILLLGKCRVGSTALANVFGHCNIPAYYQPLKALLRSKLVEQSYSLPILPKDREHICIKETFGPYTIQESMFDPLSLLLAAGYPADKICVVLLERNPHDTLKSWLNNWSGKVAPKTLVRNFVLASYQRLAIEAVCKNNCIDHIIHKYEISNAANDFHSLFNNIGIGTSFCASALHNWKYAGSTCGNIDRVVFPKEPTVFEAPKLHGRSEGFNLKHEQKPPLTSEQLDIIERFRLSELYCTELFSTQATMRAADVTA